MMATKIKLSWARCFLVLFIGIWLFSTACTNTKYYNRYPKDKECKVKDKGKKGWKK